MCPRIPMYSFEMDAEPELEGDDACDDEPDCDLEEVCAELDEDCDE